MKGVVRTGLGVLGVVLALVSVVFVAAAIGDIVTGDPDTAPGVLWGLLVFFLGTAAGGGWMAWTNLRRVRAGAPADAAELERRILDLARRLGGRVTIVEVASRCGVSVADAKASLSRLTALGVIEPSLTDDGVMLYTVAGFLPPPAQP